MVTLAICSGLCILLQPLVLLGWNTEKACVDWNLMRCVAMGGGGGGRINVAVECHTQYRHKPSSLYAETAHHDCPLLCVAPMCSDES